MRRDFYLEEGIYCKGLINDFKLYYDTIELTPSCSKISYMPNDLLVYKTGNTIYICEPKISYAGINPKLIEIMHFESNVSVAYALVCLHGESYIIDRNLQISFYRKSRSF